jgi:predicted transposase/invertase (TIGR01784 family)
MEKIINPHDRLFRETLSDRDTAADFLKNYLPEEILKLTDLNSLEICKESFVEDDLKEYYSDLLYRVTISDEEAYIYFLFEHKSYPDREIFLQLPGYMLGIWRLERKQKESFLPLIVPIVLYHGKRKWMYGTRFSSMFSESSRKLSEYIPDFGFVLRDLTQYSDEEIRGEVTCRTVLLLFRHIFDDDIAEKLPAVFSLMSEITESEGGLRFLEKILRYLFSATDRVGLEELKHIAERSVPHGKGRTIMTIAEQLRKEGYDQAMLLLEKLQHEKYEQGMQRGMQQGIREGLLDAIEARLESGFGDKGLEMMPVILRIQDSERLRSIRNVIKTAKDISEIRAIIGN